MPAKRRPGGRLNALRDGIFAKELVIASAGESQAEFDRLRSRLWNDFAPQNVATELCVEELAITYWRLQRPRRSEAAEIRKQIETARCRRQLEKIAQLNSVKNKFFSARYRLHLETNLLGADRLALESSIAETRRSLESTPLGLEFLIKQLVVLKSDVKIYGYLRPHMETLLLQACGVEGITSMASSSSTSLLKMKGRNFTRLETSRSSRRERSVLNNTRTSLAARNISRW